MRRLLALLATIFLSIPSLAQVTPDALSPDELLARRLDQAILREHLGQFWGAIAVSKNGKTIIAKGYGLANDNLDPIAPDSLFDIGSIAKQFTAAAILKLSQQGKLQLTDPVSTFFNDLPERGFGITLLHLLSHTSGMTDQRAIQPLDFADRDAAVRKAIASAPNAAIGERFEYCNAGYIVLAAVIEKVTGQSFEDYMRNEIFKPAGLKSTGFIDGIGLDPKKQTLRVIAGRGKPRRTPLFTTLGGEPWAWGLKGAGGVATTVEDMLHWDAVLRTDALLKSDARKRLYEGVKGGYALGWFVEPTGAGGMKVHHGGGTRGYRAQFSRFLDDNIAIMVCTNDAEDPSAIEKLLVRELLPGESDSLELELNLSGLALNQWKAADVDNGVTCRVSADGPRIRLEARKQGRTFAAVAMSKGIAKLLLGQIQGVKPSGRAEEDSAAVVATLPYKAEGDTIRITSDLTWQVMPSYNGQNPDTGEVTTDNRLTVVAIDAGKGFWPLILKLGAPAAKDLETQLDRVCNPKP